MVKLFSSPVWLLLILLLESDYVCLSTDVSPIQDTGTDSSDAGVIFIRIVDCKIVACHSLPDFRDIMKLGAAAKKLILISLLIFYVNTHKILWNRDLLFSCESPLRVET